MAKGLTKRQAEILEFVIESIRDYGRPPTIAEIGEEFGIASTNGVNDHLVALEKKGYITRSSKARGIHVTEKAAVGLYRSEVATLPLVGRIAAGQPILAEENIEGHVAVSASQAKPAAYCLRVSGDSMIEDGILDGDVIIVDQSLTPMPGDIVVALVTDEATVKRYYPHKRMVELRPANARMDSMLVRPEEVQFQGVVVGLHRTLR
ncbi:MAG TPA: transcriptional repressor LexA [Candidatus Hydrogenedentes bacterium]|nr:transcriptional repressor LexA [Candidatus Hydrogenedentota bacterium]HIJ74220.1 transcriptional repressor LexA [Candidatus Hydrogenedentota bacterium]